MWGLIDSGLRHYFREHPDVHAALPALLHNVAEVAGKTPGFAASRLLECLKH